MTPDPINRISDFHKAALHALIFSPEDWESRFADELQKYETSRGYSTLVGFAAGAAVRRKFSPVWSPSDVVRYVAGLRAALGEDASQIDPRLTEKLICFLLGDDSFGASPIPEDEQGEILSIAIVLFIALVAEADLDELGVDELINEAADNAGQFNWSSLILPKSAGSPHLEGGRDEGTDGAEGRGVGRGPSRGAGGSWGLS